MDLEISDGEHIPRDRVCGRFVFGKSSAEVYSAFETVSPLNNALKPPVCLCSEIIGTFQPLPAFLCHADVVRVGLSVRRYPGISMMNFPWMFPEHQT